MLNDAELSGLAVALGVGLLIGIVRERRHAPQATVAGVRTHTLVALLGCLVWSFGLPVLAAALVVVGAFVVASYRVTAQHDRGLTGEVTVLVTLLLGATAARNPPLAAGLAVLVAGLLALKTALQRFSRDLIHEQELHDVLMLAAAALIVMPLLPDHPVDPWGVLQLPTLWRIVVLVMAVGIVAHIAQRLVGPRWGLLVAGFLSGWVSSTAANASFGHWLRSASSGLTAETSRLKTRLAASAALLSQLASLVLLILVLATVSPSLVQQAAIMLAAALLLLSVAAAVMAWPMLRPAIMAVGDGPSGQVQRHSGDAGTTTPSSIAEPLRASLGTDSSFKLSHAAALMLTMAAITLLTAWLHAHFGQTGGLAAAVTVALVEVHAAAVTLGQLYAGGGLSDAAVLTGLVLMLAATSASKAVVAVVSGGKRYGLLVMAGQTAMLVGAVAGYLLTGR